MAQSFATNAVNVSGDVTGTTDNNTVVKIQGKTLASSLASVGSSQDGYVLTWVNANSDWEAKATTGGSGSGGLTAPVTSTVRTNTSNATYTVDTTGGGNDYTILNSNALTALSVTFAVTNGSQVVTSSASTTISGGTCIVFGSDTVSYVIATTGTTTTTFALSTPYQGTTVASGVPASTFSYYTGNYVLPAPTAGRVLQINETTGFAETNPINILPHTSENIEKIPGVLTVTTPMTVINGTNFVIANPFLQPVPTIVFTLTTNSINVTNSGSNTGLLFPGSQIVFSTQPRVVYQVATVTNSGAFTLQCKYNGTPGNTTAGNSLVSINFTTNGTTSVTANFNGSTISVANILFPGNKLQFYSYNSGATALTIQQGTGGSTTNATYTVSSVSGSTITLTAAASFSQSNGMAATVNTQSLGGTFNITNGNVLVTASQSQSGYIGIGSQIYFNNAGTLNGDAAVQTIASISPDGKTIQLSATYAGTTRSAASAIADLTNLSIGGLGLPYGGNGNSILFGSDTTYYPMINISSAQTTLTTSGSVATSTGDFQVVNGSTAAVANTTQANVLFTTGNTIIFGNQPYATYTIANFNGSTGITLATNFTGGTSNDVSGITIGPNTYASTLTNASTNVTLASTITNILSGSPIIFSTQPGIVYIVSTISTAGTAVVLTKNYTGPGAVSAVITLLSSNPVLQLATNYVGTTGAITSIKLTNYSYNTNFGTLQLFSPDGTNWSVQ